MSTNHNISLRVILLLFALIFQRRKEQAKYGKAAKVVSLRDEQVGPVYAAGHAQI